MPRPFANVLISWPALWLMLAASVVAAGPPARIVSINLCTDQILYDLVPPERIAALSYLASDPSVSSIARQARRLPAVKGNAEEVLAFDPDLILAGSYAKPATVNLLKRLGRRVVVVPLANDIGGIRKTVRKIAAAAGAVSRGEELIARFDKRLAAVAARVTGDRPSAVFYQVSSLAAGRGGLADAALRASGLANLASQMKLGPGGRLPLETLVVNPPDLIVLGAGAEDYRTPAADNLRHPAFRKLIESRPVLRLPQPLLLCGTLRIAAAIEKLAAARAAITAKALRQVPPTGGTGK